MVTNAQAALRLLDCQATNLEEVRCALASIIQDGNRACKVIGCMRALIQKRPLQRDHLLRVGPLELDLLDRIAKRGDRQIDLRPREFHLLKYMMQRSDKLLTRETLLKEVWNYRVVPETNLVDVHIGRLRRKIDGPNGPFLIRNVRGIGFVLSATPFSHCSPPRPGRLAIEQFFAPGCRDAAMVTDNESRIA
jgi:DNA-binding response OmpR family regulator